MREDVEQNNSEYRHFLRSVGGYSGHHITKKIYWKIYEEENTKYLSYAIHRYLNYCLFSHKTSCLQNDTEHNYSAQKVGQGIQGIL